MIILIKRETLIINEKKFIRTYSDKGYYILQVETGIKYNEAIDVENAPYTYKETKELIEPVEEEA